MSDGRQILLVKTKDNLRTTLELLLAKAGFTVTTVSDPQSALPLIETMQYAAVILDLYNYDHKSDFFSRLPALVDGNLFLVCLAYDGVYKLDLPDRIQVKYLHLPFFPEDILTILHQRNAGI